MPVYYEEKSERKQFIKEVLKNSNVAVDTGCFAGYLYKDTEYGKQSKLEYNEYDSLMQEIHRRFPRTDTPQLLKETFTAIYELEKEYIKTWKSKKTLNEQWWTDC